MGRRRIHFSRLLDRSIHRLRHQPRERPQSMGFRHGRDRHCGDAGNQPACARHHRGDHRARLSRPALFRQIPAGQARAFGPRRHAHRRVHLLDPGGHVRRCRRYLRHLRVSLHDLRRLPGSERRRPVLHGPRHFARRQVARRTGQDRRHHLRAVRLDLGLLGRQRGFHRHLHHSPDEAPRLQAASRRRHRSHRLDRRPVHAADHGRRRFHPGDADGNRIPEDRADERDPGVPLFLLPALHGRPGGAEERPEGTG